MYFEVLAKSLKVKNYIISFIYLSFLRGMTCFVMKTFTPQAFENQMRSLVLKTITSTFRNKIFRDGCSQFILQISSFTELHGKTDHIK